MNSCPPRQLLIAFLLRPLQRREDSYKRVCMRRTGRPCTKEDSVMVRICWTLTSPSQADIMIRKQLLKIELKEKISRRKVPGKNDDFSVRWKRIQPGFGKSAATFRAHRIFTFLRSASVHSVAYNTTQCYRPKYSILQNATCIIHYTMSHAGSSLFSALHLCTAAAVSTLICTIQYIMIVSKVHCTAHCAQYSTLHSVIKHRKMHYAFWYGASQHWFCRRECTESNRILCIYWVYMQYVYCLVYCVLKIMQWNQ